MFAPPNRAPSIVAKCAADEKRIFVRLGASVVDVGAIPVRPARRLATLDPSAPTTCRADLGRLRANLQGEIDRPAA